MNRWWTLILAAVMACGCSRKTASPETEEVEEVDVVQELHEQRDKLMANHQAHIKELDRKLAEAREKSQQGAPSESTGKAPSVAEFARQRAQADRQRQFDRWMEQRIARGQKSSNPDVEKKEVDEKRKELGLSAQSGPDLVSPLLAEKESVEKDFRARLTALEAKIRAEENAAEQPEGDSKSAPNDATSAKK